MEKNWGDTPSATLNNSISSNLIFELKVLRKLGKFDRSSKVLWWSDRTNISNIYPLYHAFFGNVLKDLLKIAYLDFV